MSPGDVVLRHNGRKVTFYAAVKRRRGVAVAPDACDDELYLPSSAAISQT